jgi:hypothetical protein
VIDDVRTAGCDAGSWCSCDDELFGEHEASRAADSASAAAQVDRFMGRSSFPWEAHCSFSAVRFDFRANVSTGPFRPRPIATVLRWL